MLIDLNLNKQYKFILVFETYAQNLRQYLDQVSAKKLQLLKEDIVNLFRVIIQSLYYLEQNKVHHFNPVCMTNIVICSDTSVKFNCIPLLITPTTLEKAKQEAKLYHLDDKSTTYQQTVYSFGLIFIQIFLMKNIALTKDTIKMALKEIQIKYGDTYKNYIEAMVETDKNKRITLQELVSQIQNAEPFKVLQGSTNQQKVLFSETFEFYRKSYEIQQKYEVRSIALGLPWTRLVLLSNLFNMKNYFLELVDLQISQLISDKATTLIAGQFRIFILGGINSHYIYELEEETLIQRTSFPNSITNRWGFGSVIIRNQLFICSGMLDQVLVPLTHMLNLETMQWYNLPNCNKPSVGCMLVSFQDQIFKITGESKPSVEQLDQQWRVINFRLPAFQIPSFGFAVQANAAQIFILGGKCDKYENYRIITMNVDLQSRVSDEDFVYVEFVINNTDYSQFGPVEQIQISNNILFMIQKKDEKHRYLTQYHHLQGFTDIRKIHI